MADTYGLSEAAAVVRDVLVQDRSMNAWTARGAMVCLDVVLESVNNGAWDVNLDTMIEIMGLQEGLQVRSDIHPRLSEEAAQRIQGLASYSMAIYWCVSRLYSETRGDPDRGLYERMFLSD